MSGDKVGGIASFNSCGGSIQMSDVRISTEFKAKEILGIGADKNFGEIIMNDCTFDSLYRGSGISRVGSADCEGTLTDVHVSGTITVRSGIKTLLGVKPENLISDHCIGLKFVEDQ